MGAGPGGAGKGKGKGKKGKGGGDGGWMMYGEEEPVEILQDSAMDDVIDMEDENDEYLSEY